MTPVKTMPFSHKGVDYLIVASVAVDGLSAVIQVQEKQSRKPALIAYPDGFKATIKYHVDFTTAYDLAVTREVNAIDLLMQTAEDDIKRLI